MKTPSKSAGGVTAPLSAKRLWLGFGVIFGAAVFLGIPARLVTSQIEKRVEAISIGQTKGTVWRGSLKRVVQNRILYGDIDYAIRPLSLLKGSLSYHVTMKNGIAEGEGNVGIGLGGRILASDVIGEADLSYIKHKYLLGRPFEGAARVDLEELSISQSGCRKAKGNLWTDALSAPVRMANGGALELAGEISCKDRVLMAAFSGENNQLALDVDALFEPELRYNVEIAATTGIPNIKNALLAAGFQPQNGALKYTTIGVLKGAGS